MLGMMNWRTTLIGALLAGVTYFGTVMQTGNWADWKTIAMSALIVALGYAAKDAGVTGIVK